MTNAAILRLIDAQRDARDAIARSDDDLTRLDARRAAALREAEWAKRELAEVTQALRELRGPAWCVQLGDGHLITDTFPSEGEAVDHINRCLETLAQPDPRWVNVIVFEEGTR